MSRLEAFLQQTFGEEGSFQKNPKDTGNYYKGVLYGTIWGITAKNHFSTFMTCLSLYQAGKIKESREYAANFYRKSCYWNSLYDKIADSSLAFRIFDFGINGGVVTSVKYVQEVIKNYLPGYKVDGVFGEYTLRDINRLSNPSVRWFEKIQLIDGETEFYTLYIKRLDKHYRGIKNFFTFGTGWTRRLNRIFNGVPDLYQPLNLKENGFEKIQKLT
jgi:lysozyme family protein